MIRDAAKLELHATGARFPLLCVGMEFRDVWQRIGELEGDTFRTDRGEEFSYRFRKTYVVVSLGNVSVPRTNFEKVFRRSEQGHVGGTSVQGERFITAIFRGAGTGAPQD